MARPLSKLSLSDLQRELRTRQRSTETRFKSLQRRRDGLQQRLDAVDAEMASLASQLGRSARQGGRRRPQNDSNLADALVQVLTGKTLSVTDVAEAVQKAGYQTSSPNFRTIVNQTLIKDKRIKRVERGQYTAK